MKTEFQMPMPYKPETFPHFFAAVNRIGEKSIFQKKRLIKEFALRDAAFFEEAERVFSSFDRFLRDQHLALDYAVDAYLGLCADMMQCQALYQQTGKYPACDFAKANEEVYRNKEKMTLYMIGLALSQFLWWTHYEMYCCLIRAMKERAPRIRSYLEIGPGHGLSLAKAVEFLEPSAAITGIDVSEASLAITKSILPYFGHPARPITFLQKDILKTDLEGPYDFVTMGEVLEHVEEPAALLQKIRPVLGDQSRLYISTCVNCPAVDHIYQFMDIDHIRKMVIGAGFAIEEERVLPVERLPLDEIMRRKITVNYCAILRVA